MQYGICHLSLVPVYSEPNNNSLLQTQLLYGERFKVVEHGKQWSKIRIDFDSFEGWIHNFHFELIEEADYKNLYNLKPVYNTDLVQFVKTKNQALTPIVLGAQIDSCAFLQDEFDAVLKDVDVSIVNNALLYLNAPDISGGKSPFGIDAAGLSQMAYRLSGLQLKRTALEQSKQGEAMSFIEEAQPGDLAFFDTKEGLIDHVGIILPNHHIIHSFGKVRIDRIDHTGIFNPELKQYTHSLRVIKKIA